jgi:ATP-dependent DNA ligase
VQAVAELPCRNAVLDGGIVCLDAEGKPCFEDLQNYAPTQERIAGDTWTRGITADELEQFAWVEPQVRVQVRFAEWAKPGVLRHAALETCIPSSKKPPFLGAAWTLSKLFRVCGREPDSWLKLRFPSRAARVSSRLLVWLWDSSQLQKYAAGADR